MSAAQQPKDYYRQVFEHSTEAVLLTAPDGKIFAANPAACQLFGRTEAEICQVGRPGLVDEAASPKFNEFIAERARTGQARAELTLIRGDGSRFTGEVSSALFTDDQGTPRTVLIARDLTAQKQYEHELRISAVAFDGSQEAMILTDPNQVILRVNKAFTALTGYTLEEVIGKTPAMLKSDRQDEKFYQTMWENLNQNRYWQGEVWNRRKNGELYPEWLSITAVVDDNNRVTNYVAALTDLTAHKKAEEVIHHLAFYDSLTGLPNRQLLLDRLKQSLLSNVRKQHQSAILFVDLDDFKAVNDTRGHAAGDALLVEIAKRLQTCVLPEDTLARLGSDEFAVVLDALSPDTEAAAMQAEEVAIRMHNAIKQPFNLQGQQYQCTACIGISLFSNQDTSLEELLKRADAAMFQAKDTGRDMVHFFDADMQAALEARVLLQSWLQIALPEQLRLFYQVQVDSRGNTLGAEALVRWEHPEQGMISPAAFIPLAEETGLILPIGRWVLETACRQIKAWEQDPRTRHLVLAVNVSAKQFHQDDFVDQVLAVLQQTEADPTRLKLELTESMLVENVDAIVAKMTALINKGVHFALDDFGTGFSSLSYLKRLPLDQLKIDQSFVRYLNTDPNDAAIVRTVIALGHSLGLAVIAEGVENEEQKNFLAIHGCNQYQGFLFGQPLPLEEFEQLIKRG